jgi:hypothetical protein
MTIERRSTVVSPSQEISSTLAAQSAIVEWLTL